MAQHGVLNRLLSPRFTNTLLANTGSPSASERGSINLDRLDEQEGLQGEQNARAEEAKRLLFGKLLEQAITNGAPQPVLDRLMIGAGQDPRFGAGLGGMVKQENPVITRMKNFATSKVDLDINSVRDAIARGTLPGPRILTSLRRISARTGSVEDIRRFVRAQKNHGADVIKVFKGEHTTCYDKEHGMQYVTDGHEKYIWFHHTGEEQFFNLDQDPLECQELSKHPDCQERVALWRSRLADINEQRGDPRGQNGQLVPQPDGALSLSPNYTKWKEQAAALMD